MRILWVSPHCWTDYVLRSPGLGIKSQGGQTVVMYHCPRALAELDSNLQIDIYARMDSGESEVIQYLLISTCDHTLNTKPLLVHKLI